MENNIVAANARQVDFLFEYEVKNREFDSICLVAAYLELQGYTTAFVNSWDSLYHKPMPYRAKVMVISACYNDSVYDYFCGHAYEFDKVVNLQWEQIHTNGLYNSKERTSWNYEGTVLNVRHICWGEKEIHYLIDRYAFRPEYLFNCGYIPLDFYRPELRLLSKNKKELYNKYNLSHSKKTLLFISSFSYVGLPKSEEAIAEKEKIAEIRKIHGDSQKVIIDWFSRLLKNHPELQIVYRPHPSEADNEMLHKLALKNEGFFVIKDESIRNWILNCDVLYNWESTSVIEMYASNKKTCIIRPIEIPFEEDMPVFAKEKYHAITTYEELENSLNNDEWSIFPGLNDELLDYYDIQDIPSFQRVGDLLINTFRDNQYHSRGVTNTIFDNATPKLLERIKENIKKSALFYILVRASKFIWMGNKTIKAKFEKILEKDSKEMERHDEYFREKGIQNRSTEEEIRETIDRYKQVLKTMYY